MRVFDIKRLMKHKVRFFRQHSSETCGSSCILMVLYAFGRVQYPTAGQERMLYTVYKCRSFMGTLGSSIAECLARNRLKVSLLHSSADYIDNRDDYFPPDLFDAIREEYSSEVCHIRERVDVETNVQISPELYRGLLDSGKLLIVQCIVPGDADGMHSEVLHWILLYGYAGEEFLACDPLSSKIRLSEAELLRYTDTPIGHICIAAGESE